MWGGSGVDSEAQAVSRSRAARAQAAAATEICPNPKSVEGRSSPRFDREQQQRGSSRRLAMHALGSSRDDGSLVFKTGAVYRRS